MRTDRARAILDEYDALAEAIDLSVARMDELRHEMASLTNMGQFIQTPKDIGQNVSENAKALFDWINVRWDADVLITRDVLQFGPGSLRRASVAIPALERLEASGVLERLPAGTVVGGVPRKTAWQVK